MAKRGPYKDIDEYIRGFPPETRGLLQKVRSVIREAAPEATETINYQIPTFLLYGNLVHFAGFKNHIGFYPSPSGIEKFKDRLSGYEWAKGSVKFPVDKPLPVDLIRDIVKYRVAESLEKVKGKRKIN